MYHVTATISENYWTAMSAAWQAVAPFVPPEKQYEAMIVLSRGLLEAFITIKPGRPGQEGGTDAD